MKQIGTTSMAWVDRKRNVEQLLSPFDCEIAQDDEAGSGPEQAVLIFASLWMHLRGYSASDVVAVHRVLVASSCTDTDMHDRWVSEFRCKGVPEKLAGLELGALFEAAVACYSWSGSSGPAKLDVLPAELSEIWERAHRCAAFNFEPETYMQVLQADPELAGYLSNLRLKARVDQFLDHIDVPRKMLAALGADLITESSAGHSLAALTSGLLQLELPSLGDSDLELEFPQVVRTAREVMTVELVVRSGWVELGEVAPEFVRQRFVTGGFRFFRYGTGDMTTVTVFAETEDEVTRWARFCRAPRSIAIRHSGSKLELMPVLYQHAGDTDPVFGPTSFELTSHADRADLVRSIVQGGMRLEVFRERDGSISAAEVGFIPLRAEQCEKLYQLLRPYRGEICSRDQYLAESLPDLDESLQAKAEASETARFELLFELSVLRSRVHFDLDKRLRLDAAARGFLRDISRQGTSSSVVPDSRSNYFDALADTGRPPRPKLPDLLSERDLIVNNRWILYVDLRSNRTELVAVGCDESGTAQYEVLSIGLNPEVYALIERFQAGLRSSEWSNRAEAVAELASWLAKATALLAQTLRERGASEVLVCSGHSLQWLPLHLAEPWIGLISGYVPALAFCQSWTDDHLPEGTEVHSGRPSDLALVAKEVSVVRQLSVRGSQDPEFLLPRTRRVHFAGHAIGRGAPNERGLELGGAAVTVPRILAEADYIGVELVTLSGCSTGAFDQVSVGPQELGGVDFALLARGARCVISTMWNVHDSASALFMVALHADLAGGLSIQESFSNAQTLLRTGAASKNASMTLEDRWRSWREDVFIDTSQEVHWGAFRIAGRYW